MLQYSYKYNMTHKISDNNKATINTSKLNNSGPKVATTLVQKALTQTANNSPSLSTKKVTYSNPFLTFINLLLSIFGFSIGYPIEEPQAVAPETKEIILPAEAAKPPINPETSSKFKKVGIKPKASPKSESTTLEKPKDAKTDVKSKELEQTKSQITELYRAGLLDELKKDRAEQKATEIFNTIFPAFYAGLQKHLETTVDLAVLKKPLKALAKTLIEEYEVNHMLQEISVSLTKGALVLNREQIFKAYPSLKVMLEKMPEQSKQFEMILSKTWIAKELKNLSAYQGGDFEITVLESLGYSVSSYDDKQFFQEAMETFYAKADLPSIEDLPIDFKKQAFNLRARAADVPEEALLNLRMLLRFYHQKRQELIDEAKVARDSLQIQSKAPLAIRFIKQEFYGRNLDNIDNHLIQFLNGAKADILKNLFSPDFKNFLDSLPPFSKGLNGLKVVGQDLKKAEAWFTKYESMIIGEFSQGEKDKNEALGTGVCLGLAYRSAVAALESPLAVLREILVRSIEPLDRAIQAFHTLNVKSASPQLLPPKLLAKHGHEEKALFTSMGDMNVRDALVKQLQDPSMKESKGGIILGWGRHATFMRFDLENNKFSFFDPNFNTLVFRRKTDETSQELAKRMVTAYIELYQWAYPNREMMTARQIIPSQPFNTRLNKTI